MRGAQDAAPAAFTRSATSAAFGPYGTHHLRSTIVDPDIIAFGNVMQILLVSTAGFVAIGLGARLLWRWGSRIKPSSSRSLEAEDRDDRLRHLETAVDSIAIEVERISEAQRFVVGLLAESNQLRRAERADPAELPLPANRAAGRTNTPH